MRSRSSTWSATRRSPTSAARSAPASAFVEHVKRYTTIGTGSDQGKTANVERDQGRGGAARASNRRELGTTSFRPPYMPLSFSLLAGRDAVPLFDPVRETPIHPWHVEHGAVFENVGQWHRPRYFPREGETMEAAVLRECAAAREGVAMMDASTLGKIDVQGPDAVAFLDRLYTNAYGSLAVGMCRYGVMCRADGMVFDDGVVMRLRREALPLHDDDRERGRVLDWMEEWLQTEWSELRVWLTSVTEQWATVAVVGPDSRALLGGLTSIPLGVEEFPFMAIREGEVAGDPGPCVPGELLGRARLRGERRRPARARAVGGARPGPGLATPYGTETMHVLRAEKGYPIVGQDTDGTVTPLDLGMSWIVSNSKPFVGSRSFTRADTARADRKQLVGLAAPRPGGAAARGGAARRRRRGRSSGADGRPRHLELPQRGARAKLRPRPREGRPGADG